MNFSQYLKLAQEGSSTLEVKTKKFTFFENNRPFVEYQNGDRAYLSEVLLFKEDLTVLEEDLKSLGSGSPFFYLDGKKFKIKTVDLKDIKAFEVETVVAKESRLDKHTLPGFINDWCLTKHGILIFYGSLQSDIDLFRQLFLQKRATAIKGKSLIFWDRDDFADVGAKEHFCLFTQSNEERASLSSFRNKIKFDYYSHNGDLIDCDLRSVLKLSDQNALISINSEWGRIDAVLNDLNFAVEQTRTLKKHFYDAIIGFVGVKRSAEGEIIFEALPNPKDKSFYQDSLDVQIDKLRKSGITFNQSLQTLILKRKLKLEEAYELSPNVEELNNFLDAAGV